MEGARGLDSIERENSRWKLDDDKGEEEAKVERPPIVIPTLIFRTRREWGERHVRGKGGKKDEALIGTKRKLHGEVWGKCCGECMEVIVLEFSWTAASVICL